MNSWQYALQVLAEVEIIKRNLRSGYTMIELALVLAIIAVLAAMLFPLVQERESKQKAISCQSNLKQLGFAVDQYRQDYDDCFSLIASNAVLSSVAPFAAPFGWADALYPYTKNAQLLQCAGEGRPANRDATKNGFSDYWYNANLDALPVKMMASPSTNFLIGDYRESSEKRMMMNARFHIETMPMNWLDTDTSRTRRHPSNNYLFADGHVAGYRTGYHDMTVH